MTESKPPVGELPDEIWAVKGEEIWTWKAVQPNYHYTRYVRADKSVLIPADDFGRILEALVAIAGDNDTDGNSMECDNHEACQDKAFEALALARKYGSAE